MRKLNLLLASVISTLVVLPTSALEPLPDRAVVERMNADLLLPDGSTVNVDVSFDCGSDYQNTAIIVMSDSGAQLLAAAYTHLYGEKYGQQVLDAWNNKKNKEDPRKPSYLFAISPREKEFKWRENNSLKLNKRLTSDIMPTMEQQSTSQNESEFIPAIATGCGTKIHDPQVAE